MDKPTVFIGSTRQGLEVAGAIQQNLADEAHTVLWTDGVFSPDYYSLDSLLRSLDKIDFAIVVLEPDDLALQHPRENVIFELGLFMGRLGRSRVFVVMGEGDAPIQLPSDLAGVMVARFRRRADGNVLAALAPASTVIRQQIIQAVREVRPVRPPSVIEQYSCFISYSAQDKEFVERIYKDLRDVGIRCWLDSKDLKTGDHIDYQIDRAIQVTDKVLLVLSQASVNSRWVRLEIEGALRKEAKAKKTILFPIRIDNVVMKASDEISSSLVRTKQIGDFTNWTMPDDYRRAFSRLVKDLTVSAAVEQDRKM
jgi:hypothetical protein